MLYSAALYERGISCYPRNGSCTKYCPVVHDIVTIKGDHGQIWKACVLSFNLTPLTINARFFVEDGTQPGMWVPERSRVQVVHFKSILGISEGYWTVAYSFWVVDEE